MNGTHAERATGDATYGLEVVDDVGAIPSALREMQHVQGSGTAHDPPQRGGHQRGQRWPDAVLVFPGDHSWGGEYRGKAEIEGFLRRFVAAGLIGEVREVLVNGPPWNTRVCVLFSDHVKDDAGNVVYENDAVLYGRIKWGKIVYQQDFEDTQKVVAFDAYLAAE